jgi:repressor LexA
MQTLTQKQDSVLKVVKSFIQNQGHAPSLSELQKSLLANGMNAKSKRSVVQYLEALESKGYISRSSEERGIKIYGMQESENFMDLPIYGEANAGAALVFAEENIQGFIKVSKKLLKSTQNIFALKISGDSMNQCQLDNKYIEDGDFVVVDKTAQGARNNDIILAIVDGCATIKKFTQTLFGEIILMPHSSNPHHQPIYIHESDSFFINGRVINVLKNTKNL